jgi:hypothetical protein
MKLTIWYGSQTPMVAIGKNQVQLLGFAEKYKGWHTFKQDKATRNAINTLKNKGYLEVIDDQFRLVYP